MILACLTSRAFIFLMKFAGHEHELLGLYDCPCHRGMQHPPREIVLSTAEFVLNM